MIEASTRNREQSRTRSRLWSGPGRRSPRLARRGPGRRSPRLARRLAQLYVGLTCYGISAALQVQARLGLDPWDVLHQGVARRLGWQIGTVSIVVGALVLLGWLPIRQRPGLGTVSNVVVIGSVMNAALALLPAQHHLIGQFACLLGGIVLCGAATGLYISAGFGPGPRDGLMTGWSARTGVSIRLTRTVIEASVLVVGWLLGGTAGIGTVLFAILIGPLAQLFLRVFSVQRANTKPVAGLEPFVNCETAS